MFITLKRIILSGIKTFFRNGFLSWSSILTLAITLVIAGVFYLTIILGQFVIQKVESKVDINIYFSPEAQMEKVLEFKKELLNLSEVDKEKTKLFTKEEALEDFRKSETGNSLINDVMNVLGGENPLGSVLNLKAKNITSYTNIISFLESDKVQAKYLDIIDSHNYNENQFVIDRIKIWLKYTKIISGSVLALFALISLIIIFNTIRLVIYSYREEIQVMRLIGASKFFARGPFLVEAMLFGLIAGILSIFMLWSLIYFTTDLLKQILSLNLNQYFSDHILIISSVLILAGIVISFSSTYFAVSKYLKIDEDE